MANRTFDDSSYTMVKREVRLYAAVLVAEGGAVSLRKWNYPTFGSAASPARTYTAAPTTPAGQGYPLMYQTGAEGIRSVSRVSAGTWLLTLQDNYQRVLGVNFVEQSTGGTPTVVACGLGTAGTNMDATNGSVLGLVFASATGVAADPGSGSLVLLNIVLGDATEP